MNQLPPAANRYKHKLGLLLLAFLIGSGISFASEEPAWELGLGMSLLSVPDYPGANERMHWALPFPYLVYRGRFLQADGDEVRGLLFDSNFVQLDISGGGSLPVSGDDNRAREGMPSLDLTFEMGPSLRFNFIDTSQKRLIGNLNLRALMSLDFPSVNYQGWIFNPELTWQHPITAETQLGVALNWRYADSGYHRFFYDVEQAFATPQRPAFRASRGYSGSSVGFFIDWRPNRDWRLRSTVTYLDLNGVRFRDSPLVKQNYAVYFSLVVSRVLLRSKPPPPPRLQNTCNGAECLSQKPAEDKKHVNGI